MCSGMWNIDLKIKKNEFKKMNSTHLPYFFLYVTPIKQLFFLGLMSSVVGDLISPAIRKTNLMNSFVEWLRDLDSDTL